MVTSSHGRRRGLSTDGDRRLMARVASGQVVERRTVAGIVYALRFRAYGRREYITLGTVAQGWTRARAEDELQNVLVDVRRGEWRAPVALIGPQTDIDPCFHEFASRWFYEIEPSLRPNTALDYRWQLSSHLLPFFHTHRLSQITVAEIDRYRAWKVREAALSASSINKTLTRLGQILDVAEERDLIARNPMRVNRRRRKLREPKPNRPYLDRAEHIEALLAAATELDREARHDRQLPRRAILATLTFAGLRLGELLALRWSDVDLAGGRLRVGESKTDAGRREVTLLPALRDELAALKAKTRPGGDELVFGTTTGNPQSPSNVRNRVLDGAVRRANERLNHRGRAPLPDGLTPHSLRRTFASLLFAVGEPAPAVMEQLGHTDARLTLGIYAKTMRQRQGDRERLKALVETRHWAPMGTGRVTSTTQARPSRQARPQKNPLQAGGSTNGRGGFRTCDLSRVKRALSH